MANVALFRSGQTPQYLTSVHTPDYSSDPDAIVNPDVSAVIAVALKYWKRSGNSVVEMSAGEKSAVDSAIASALLSARRSGAEVSQSSPEPDGIRLRALILVLLDEINTLRANTLNVIGIGTIAPWDPASMANGAGVTSPNITVNGAALGDIAEPSAPYTLQGVTATAYVSAANTVNIRLENQTGSAVNLASGNWSVVVRRPAVLGARTLAQARTAYTNKINAGDAD